MARDVAPITNGQYAIFDYDMNLAINSLSTVNVDIYTDASGTSFALDSSGNPITDRQIVQTSYTYPYTDEITGLPVYGYFTISFDNGTTFTNTDEFETTYWYTIRGLDPVEIKQLT